MRYPHGLFGWVDLTTTDVERARTFYTELFDWTSQDLPTSQGPAYTMLYKDGRLVAGMGPQPPGMAEAGVPSLWSSYVLVEDLDAVLALVEPASGQVTMPAMDVMEQGRMAMVADPSGAVVGLWQPMAHQGAELFNAPGSLTWNELQTRDLAAATAFYTAVLGWRWEAAGDGYQVAYLDAKEGADKSNAGAMAMPDGVPPEAPPSWMVYFAVSDCDELVASAQRLGATVFLPAMAMGPGRFAGLVDPTGAMFLLGSFPAA
jgi:predicted enzyme related to lactoylglutathione lyase